MEHTAASPTVERSREELLSWFTDHLAQTIRDRGYKLVTEESHPYLQAWWPPGHVLGWDATFTMQAADFLKAIAADRAPSPSFAEGLAVQRVLAAVEQSAHQLGACVEVSGSQLEGGVA